MVSLQAAQCTLCKSSSTTDEQSTVSITASALPLFRAGKRRHGWPVYNS